MRLEIFLYLISTVNRTVEKVFRLFLTMIDGAENWSFQRLWKNEIDKKKVSSNTFPVAWRKSNSPQTQIFNSIQWLSDNKMGSLIILLEKSRRFKIWKVFKTFWQSLVLLFCLIGNGIICTWGNIIAGFCLSEIIELDNI